MTLKISTQEDDQRQLVVTVEVDEKRVHRAMQKAAKDYARKLRIPGFRPGKAPYGIVKGYVGEENLRQDALNDILPKIFDETLQEIDAQPYAQPTLDDVDFDPLVLKMTIPLEPAVILGDYRAMRREVETVVVSDEAVDEAIELVRQQQATTEPIERPSAMGDELVIDGKGTIPAEDDGEEANTIFDQQHYHVRLEEDALFPRTDFTEQLVGLSAGDKKTFTVTFPEEYDVNESLEGKTATFEVSVQEVLERHVPELNDEFAQNQTGEFETLEDYRAERKQQLQEQAEEQAKNDLIEETIEDMLENVEELVYPQGILSAEVDDMLNGIKQQIQQIGWDWDTYLEAREMTEEDMRDEFEEGAVDRLERRLVFQKFVQTENLLLTEEEINAAVEKRLETFDEEMRGYMRPYLEGEGGAMIRQELLTNKVYDRITAIFAGAAPDLTEESDEAEVVADEPEVAEELEAIVSESEDSDE